MEQQKANTSFWNGWYLPALRWPVVVGVEGWFLAGDPQQFPILVLNQATTLYFSSCSVLIKSDHSLSLLLLSSRFLFVLSFLQSKFLTSICLNIIQLWKRRNLHTLWKRDINCKFVNRERVQHKKVDNFVANWKLQATLIFVKSTAAAMAKGLVKSDTWNSIQSSNDALVL